MLGNDTAEFGREVLADAREESGRVGVFGTDDALLEQPESFDGDVVLRVASAVERGPNLGSRRAVDVEPAVTAGPLVEPILFGVGEPGRSDVGVIVAIRIAAVHELQRQMLNEPVPIADLRRRPRTEPEFVGRDSDAVALSRVEDESVVVPGLERADVRFAGLEIGDDLAERFAENVSCDSGVVTLDCHRREVVVTDPDFELDVEFSDFVIDQRPQRIQRALAGVALDVQLGCEYDH